MKRISPYCRVHFSLLQNAFLLTAECISPYCIRSLKDPAHHIPNQTEIATEEFCPKSLLRKQNEIDFIESHFQILHHLKIVHLAYAPFVNLFSNLSYFILFLPPCNLFLERCISLGLKLLSLHYCVISNFQKWARAPQHFTCDSACAAIIFKRLRLKYFSNFERNRASATQIQLGRMVFQSNEIKVKTITLMRYTNVARNFDRGRGLNRKSHAIPL